MSTPLELSVQELVSCSENAGCEGGSIIGTLDWLANSRFSGQVSIVRSLRYIYSLLQMFSI